MHYVYDKKSREDFAKIRKKLAGTLDYNKQVEQRDFVITVSFKTLIKQWCSRAINKSVELVDDKGNLIYKYK